MSSERNLSNLFSFYNILYYIYKIYLYLSYAFFLCIYVCIKNIEILHCTKKKENRKLTIRVSDGFNGPFF